MGIPMYTTPTFTLDFSGVDGLNLTEASNVYVTFKSKHSLLTKSGESLVVEPKSIQVRLTQSDTSNFSIGPVEIQANWVLPGGFRFASNVCTYEIDRQLLQTILGQNG